MGVKNIIGGLTLNGQRVLVEGDIPGGEVIPSKVQMSEYSYLDSEKLHLYANDNTGASSDVAAGVAEFWKYSSDEASNGLYTRINGSRIETFGTHNGPPVYGVMTPELIHMGSDHALLGDAKLTKTSLTFVATYEENTNYDKTGVTTSVLTANSLHLGKDSTLAGEPTITLGSTTINETQLKALIKLLETGVQTYENGDEEVY